MNRIAAIFLAIACTSCASFKEPPTVPYMGPDGQVIGRKTVNLTGGGRALFCQHTLDGSDRCLIVKSGWAYWYLVE